MSRENLHIAMLADENRDNLTAEEKKSLRNAVKKESKLNLKKLGSIFESLIDKINDD